MERATGRLGLSRSTRRPSAEEHEVETGCKHTWVRWKPGVTWYWACKRCYVVTTMSVYQAEQN